MIKIKMLLLALAVLPCFANAATPVLTLSKLEDNSLNISFVYEGSSENIVVHYNVYYSGDNYAPTALYKKESWFGTTPDMSGDVLLDDEFVKDVWVPKILEYVENPIIWVEYSINNGPVIKSNTLKL